MVLLAYIKFCSGLIQEKSEHCQLRLKRAKPTFSSQKPTEIKRNFKKHCISNEITYMSNVLFSFKISGKRSAWLKKCLSFKKHTKAHQMPTIET